MPRTKAFTEFSAEGILSAMTPGRSYRTGFIAQSLGVGNVEVRKLIDDLVAQGKLAARYDEGAHEQRFHVVEVMPTVAGRRETDRRLTEVMSGYEDPMRQHIALAMTLRRTA